jgi:hypothetical protein
VQAAQTGAADVEALRRAPLRSVALAVVSGALR